jgi:hypothetical protein
VEETLGGLSSERLARLLALAFPLRSGGTVRLSLMLRRGDSASDDLLPVEDPGESVEARVRRYHAFTERAIISLAPTGVRVTRLQQSWRKRMPLPLRCPGGDIRAWQLGRGRILGSAGGRAERGSRGARGRASRRRPWGGPVHRPPGATAFVPEGTAYRVDRYGNLVMETGSGGRGQGLGSGGRGDWATRQLGGWGEGVD